MTATPEVTGFFDPRTFSIQYVVADPQSRTCAIIDPVLDYDEKSGSTATTNADSILAFIREHGLSVAWILDTHPHADHFTAASYLQEQTGAPIAIGEHVVDVQKIWKDIYCLDGFPTDGSQWDRLFADGEEFSIGELKARAIYSPGHTIASVTYVVGDAVFVHDTLFMPDSGTARADFPGGSSSALWASIQAILALPDDSRIFVGHDYQPGGRPVLYESTVREEKATNSHMSKVATCEAFCALRDARDRTLPLPKLILHALQVNINAGRLPPADHSGKRFLKIPLNWTTTAVW